MFKQMAAVAGNLAVPIEAVRNPSPLVHSVMAMIVLLVAAVLGIYKPQGRTPFGRRSQPT